jgi:uncharacterized OB-fold protein
MISARNATPFGIQQARDETALPAAAPGGVVKQPQPLHGTGTIYSFSVMYNVPQGYEEQKPYVIAIVQLDDGPMVTAQLTDIDHDAVAIGQRVEMVTRKLREEGAEGQIIYGYKFRPLLQDSSAP